MFIGDSKHIASSLTAWAEQGQHIVLYSIFMEKPFVSRNYLGFVWFMDDFITPLTVHRPVLLAIFVLKTVRLYLHVLFVKALQSLIKL